MRLGRFLLHISEKNGGAGALLKLSLRGLDEVHGDADTLSDELLAEILTGLDIVEGLLRVLEPDGEEEEEKRYY